jgi:hypothetical protein
MEYRRSPIVSHARTHSYERLTQAIPHIIQLFASHIIVRGFGGDLTNFSLWLVQPTKFAVGGRTLHRETTKEVPTIRASKSLRNEKSCVSGPSELK